MNKCEQPTQISLPSGMRLRSRISSLANGRSFPLAGPANRQGRIAADVIAGRDSRYRGTQGTSICQIFEAAIAQTGTSEKILNRLGDEDFEKIYLYQNSHAGYYPGAKMLAIKVLFRKSDGKLLGAQVLGEAGVAKRIDSFAMAIQMGCTIYDLEESELCYAPPFGSAKDPVNFAGMVAADVLRDDMPLCHWSTVGNGFLLDVRNPPELAVEHYLAQLNIPLPELRSRLDEIPRDREILVFCRSGQRAYYATRILLQNGFKARNIAGGMLSRSHAASSQDNHRVVAVKPEMKPDKNRVCPSHSRDCGSLRADLPRKLRLGLLWRRLSLRSTLDLLRSRDCLRSPVFMLPSFRSRCLRTSPAHGTSLAAPRLGRCVDGSRPAGFAVPGDPLRMQFALALALTTG